MNTGFLHFSKAEHSKTDIAKSTSGILLKKDNKTSNLFVRVKVPFKYSAHLKTGKEHDIKMFVLMYSAC